MVKRTRSKMLPYKLTSRHKAIPNNQKALWRTVTQDSKDFVDTNRTPWHYTGAVEVRDGYTKTTHHLRLSYTIDCVFVYAGGGQQPYTQAMLERRAERLQCAATHQRVLKRQRILRFLQYGKINLKQEKNDGE